MLIELIRIIWQRKKIIALVTLGVSLLTLIALLLTPKTYEAVAVIRIVQFTDPTSGRAQEASLIDKMSFMETNKNMLISRVVLQRLVENYPIFEKNDSATNLTSKAKLEEAVRRMRQEIALENIRFTDLLQIIVRDKSKQKVPVIANSLVDAYRQWMFEENTRSYQDMAAFLDKRVALAKKKLDEAEEAISNYGKRNAVVSIEGEIKQKLEIVGDLDVRLADLQSKIEYYRDLLEKVEQDPQNVAVYTALSEDERVKELVKAYNENELKIKLSEKYFKPTHPKYIEFTQKREELRLMLAQKLQLSCQASITDLEMTRERKQQELAKYQAELASLGQKNQSVERLKRALKTDEEIYLSLLDKYEASELLKAKKSLVEVTLISPAVEPQKHCTPRRTRTMMLGTSLGFLGAVFGAVVYARKEQIQKLFIPES